MVAENKRRVDRAAREEARKVGALRARLGATAAATRALGVVLARAFARQASPEHSFQIERTTLHSCGLHPYPC